MGFDWSLHTLLSPLVIKEECWPAKLHVFQLEVQSSSWRLVEVSTSLIEQLKHHHYHHQYHHHHHHHHQYHHHHHHHQYHHHHHHHHHHQYHHEWNVLKINNTCKMMFCTQTKLLTVNFTCAHEIFTCLAKQKLKMWKENSIITTH